MKYLDFEIEVSSMGGREYALAVRSPAGEADEKMRFPFDDLALESRLKDLQIALLRSGGGQRRISSPEEQAVQRFGLELFDALFTGEVRGRYDISREKAAEQGCGLRLKLRINAPELAALPWEFLYDNRQADYLGLSTNTPLIRYIKLTQPLEPLTVKPPLRILAMVASPSNLAELNTEQEKARVEGALESLQASGAVELVWLEGQGWRDLQREIRRGGPWHVFHFVGHGGFDHSADEGIVAFVGDNGQMDPLSARDLGRLLANHSTLCMVLLNSCEGARGSEHDLFASTAATLVRRGIPAVLAMQYEISDRAAIEFSRVFYEALVDGMPVDAAVSEARTAVSLALRNTLEWGTPVLHMRSPDGVLLHVEKQAIDKPKPRKPTVELEPQNGASKQRFRQRAEIYNTLQFALDVDSNRLHEICFLLNVEHETLKGEDLHARLRSLITEVERRGDIDHLKQIADEMAVSASHMLNDLVPLERESEQAVDFKDVADATGIGRSNNVSTREALSADVKDIDNHIHQDITAEEDDNQTNQRTEDGTDWAASNDVPGDAIEQLTFLCNLEGHTATVFTVAFSPDGRILASGSGDKTIRLWSVPEGKLLHVLKGHTDCVNTVTFSLDGQTLTSGSDDKTMRDWTVGDGLLSSTRKPPGWFSIPRSVAYSPNGSMLACAVYMSVALYDAAGGQLVRELKGHSGGVYDVAFSPDGETLASGSWDKTVRLWRVADGMQLYVLGGHKGGGLSWGPKVAFSPDGQLLAAGGAGNTILLWRVTDATLLRTLYGHKGEVNGLAFSPDGQVLASGSLDSTVCLWRVSDGRLLHTLTGHSLQVHEVAFSPDGTMLASASADEMVKLWKIGRV